MSSLTAKGRLFVSAIAALAFAAGPFLIAGTVRVPRPTLAVSQLLETNDLSLTAYLAGATAVQDITPGVLQRSVHLDGSLRAAPSVGAHIAGNPFGSVWSANRSVNGVQLATGAFELTEVDIALPSEGPSWVVGRAYSSAAASANGYQGRGWIPDLLTYPPAEMSG